MKNTWAESIETRNVCRKMDEQSDILQSLYGSDRNGFDEAIKNICKVTIDEFWRPEAFEKDNYREHMMYWKELINKEIPRQVINELNQTTDGLHANANLITFDRVIHEIINRIEFYHIFYEGLWAGMNVQFTCGCQVCFDPSSAVTGQRIGYNG